VSGGKWGARPCSAGATPSVESSRGPRLPCSVCESLAAAKGVRSSTEAHYSRSGTLTHQSKPPAPPRRSSPSTSAPLLPPSRCTCTLLPSRETISSSTVCKGCKGRVRRSAWGGKVETHLGGQSEGLAGERRESAGFREHRKNPKLSTSHSCFMQVLCSPLATAMRLSRGVRPKRAPLVSLRRKERTNSACATVESTASIISASSSAF
jgi:hypothetical protein